ncbi:MAG: carotenoid biosynthesis protein, partial [Jatrophihabitantaceae bacterium]
MRDPAGDPARPASPRLVVVVALAGATVLSQICYPLVDGSGRDQLTVVTVVLFTLASLGHAAFTRGLPVAAALLAVTAVPGFAIEVLGVHTGFPFGRYAYSSTLGPRLFDVPIVIALAWTMFAWPAALVARRVFARLPTRALGGAWALAAWDLFLDPQMVSAGHWRWRFPSPHLPGVDAVPLTNYAGWLLVASVMSLALQMILTRVPDGDDRVPIGLFVWTWGSSTLALAAFLHLGAAAGWGAIGMGIVAV